MILHRSITIEHRTLGLLFRIEGTFFRSNWFLGIFLARLRNVLREHRVFLLTKLLTVYA